MIRSTWCCDRCGTETASNEASNWLLVMLQGVAAPPRNLHICAGCRETVEQSVEPVSESAR